MVVAHHHFAPAPITSGTVMPRAKRALDVSEQLGVEMILGGHLHRAYIGNSLDVYPGKDRKHGIVIVQSGTSTSRRGRAREAEKNSFNWIFVHRRNPHHALHVFRRRRRLRPHQPARLSAVGAGVLCGAGGVSTLG